MKVVLAVVVVAAATVLCVGWQLHELARAQAALDRAEYSEAEAVASAVILPGLRQRAESICAAASNGEQKDAVAWSDFVDASQRFVAYQRDPSTAGVFNQDLLQRLQDALLEVAGRPTVVGSDRNALRVRLAAADPRSFVALVDDLRTSGLDARLIRLGVKSTDEGANYLDRAITVVALPPRGSLTETRAFALDFGDHVWHSIAPNNPVQLLDWTGGLALAFISTGTDFGGNSGDTTWSVWRLSKGGVKTTDDTDLTPFRDGIETFEGNAAAGSRDIWTSPPFDECHACPHLHEDFTAKWDSLQGRYVLVASHFDDGPYFQLVSFVNNFTYSDFTAEASSKSASFDALRLAARNGFCMVLQENVTGNSGSVALECRGIDVTVGARKVAARWKLASIAPEISYTP